MLLCGWYLLVPDFKEGTIALDAPLASWTPFSSFDTAKECENKHLDVIERSKRGAPLGHQEMELAQCIASDDPRLKEK